MSWSEGDIHVAMRAVLVSNGWKLVAGEYPGGTDHDLYALNVVDPAVARDQSPDARRHSKGELIPDIVALRGRQLLVGEAKVGYCEADRSKLYQLIIERRAHLVRALKIFAEERSCQELNPVEDLEICPVLIFCATGKAPIPSGDISYLRISCPKKGFFEGYLNGSDTRGSSSK